MSICTGLTGKTYRLQDIPFAGGGEGSIFDVIGVSDLVAKVYKSDKCTAECERKLKVMVSNRPTVSDECAWPLDVIYESGRFIGYIMSKVNGEEKLRNIYIYDNRSNKPWSLYVAIAKNLSAAVNNIHEIHQIIGDLNPNNILVDPSSGLVTLVDTDSYHISDSCRTYRCTVGMPQFVSPELHGICFSSEPLPTFTYESDRFSLAVIIFSLLMNGSHPFSCKVISGSVSSFMPVDNMLKGRCAFFKDSCHSAMEIPPYAPDISALPNNIQELFRRAFITGLRHPEKRPSAEEWFYALEKLESNLKSHGTHFYYNGLNECPWCKVNKKMIPFQVPTYNQHRQLNHSNPAIFQTKGIQRTAYQSVSSNINNTQVPVKNSKRNSFWKTNAGWIAAISAIIVLIIIFKTCFDLFSKNQSSDTSIMKGISYNEVLSDAPNYSITEQVDSSYDLEEMYVKDTWLTELDYIKKGSIIIRNESNGKANTENEFAHYMFSTSPYSEVVYHLNGNYDTLTALWSIRNNSRNTSDKNNFEIYADEILVYSSPTISGGDFPVDVSINVSGCNLLTILFKEGDGSAELANIRVSTNTNRVPNPTTKTIASLPCWLTDLDYLTNSGVSIYRHSNGKTNSGAAYSHYMSGDSGDEIVYCLNGKYARLSGMWAINSMYKNPRNDNSFEIYADGEKVYASPVITGGDAPIEFEVDIKKCEKLRIVFTNGSDTAALGNIRLFPDNNR